MRFIIDCWLSEREREREREREMVVIYLSVAPPVSSVGGAATPAWWPLEAYQSQARGRPRPVRRGASP